MERIFYYVDGEWIPHYTAYIQLLTMPEDGEIFSIDDGLGGFASFEFDKDGEVTSGSFPIPILSIFDDWEYLQKVLNLMDERALNQQETDSALEILEKYGTKRLAFPPKVLLEELTASILIIETHRD